MKLGMVILFLLVGVSPGVGAPCGGDLTNPRGEFFSPQYPNNYPNNADCTWRLLASERQVVNLTFMFVDLEECCDSIRVYDGPTNAYPLLGRLPQDQRYHFNSTKNYMTVVFSSDQRVTHQGFLAQWNFSVGTPCGGDLTNPRGEFFSPQYPNNYPNNADCTWRLLAPERQVVNLTFTFVELEECCDSIRVYDGPTDAHPLLGRLPHEQRSHFNSTRNYLTVVFLSDSSVTHQRFRAQWVFSAGAPCGQDLTNPRGKFFSPEYPNNYPNNAYCTWRLLASKTQVVNLTFTFVDVEECCDSIRVYDGPTDAYPLLGRLPQDQRYHFKSSRNYLTVMFSSDYGVTGQGFQAQWNFSVGTPCGGDLTNPRGEFFSPQYPNNYPNNADCTWRLQASERQTVNLIFTFVDSEECCDSIRVYDGPTAAYPLLGRLPQDQRYHFNSTRNYMTVVFSSDQRVTRQGFRAQWIFSAGVPCGGDLTNSRGEFFSPQYPNNYPDNADCTWRLLASDRRVNLTFTFVDLETCCDSIMVYDGPTDVYPLLGRLPQGQRYHFNSIRNSLTVVFSSDSSVTRFGFRAQWEFSEPAPGPSAIPPEPSTDPPAPTLESPSCRWNCGDNLGSCSCSSSCQYYGNCCHDYHDYCHPSTTTSDTPTVTRPTCGGHLFDSGSLSSLYYPNYYQDNAYCVWQLSVPAGQRIVLSFVDLDLDHCCDCDYINVYDGSTTASSLLGKLCYNDSTLWHFRSSSSYMTVLFRSDGSGVARGFKAFFSSTPPVNTAGVFCSSERMNIVIQRSYLDSLGISWQNLYVDDHLCRPSVTNYEVFFSFSIDMCGTRKTTKNGRIVYNNNVQVVSSQSGETTQQVEQFLLSVNCHKEQDTTVGTVYKTEVIINSTITATGRFIASMAFYPSSNFSYPILEFPYKVMLNQNLYVQVQLSRADDTLDLLVDSCVASPNHDFQAHFYTLIQNGCAKDSTVHIYTNGRQYYAQFHFRAIKSLRTHSYVFLQCRVIVCADSDHNSRCRQGCRTRKKRSLDSSHHTETVTLGPITLKGAESAAEVEKEK